MACIGARIRMLSRGGGGEGGALRYIYELYYVWITVTYYELCITLNWVML